MAAGTVRDWKWEDVMTYLRANGADIKRLALQGDKIAVAVFHAYHLAAKYPNPDGTLGARAKTQAHLNLCDALNDYVLRDLHQKERLKLAEKFGHRIGKDDATSSIILNS